MLSKSITEKTRIHAVCESSGDIRPGEVFRGMQLAERDDRLPSALEQANIICCGKINEAELLFRTEDGRYYFSICDGWGSQNGAGDGVLFGLHVGLFYDFRHPTTAETLPAACEEVLGLYRSRIGSWITAMIYNARKRTLEKILSVMQNTANE